jgi:hypothetical protein
MKGSLLFSRPYGTQVLFPALFPALKCWAIVTSSLRDDKVRIFPNLFVRLNKKGATL